VFGNLSISSTPSSQTADPPAPLVIALSLSAAPSFQDKEGYKRNTPLKEDTSLLHLLFLIAGTSQ
jgi:hypothetical protein